jgi:hypothetical protein
MRKALFCPVGVNEEQIQISEQAVDEGHFPILIGGIPFTFSIWIFCA